MSAGPGHRVRFPIAEEAGADRSVVPSIGPIVFCLRLRGLDHQVDLSDLPCPRLVRWLAQALSFVAGEDGTQRSPRTMSTSVSRIRSFVAFIAAVEPRATESFGLEDLTPELLDTYEHTLLTEYGDESKLPYASMVDVIHLLKVVHAQHPGAFGIEMQARLGFSTTTATPVKNPLDSYPLPIFEAMQAKAIEDVRSIRDRILRGERLARAGEDPEIAGWTLENSLWHIAHRGPLTQADRRRPGLRDRFHQLGGMRRLNSMLFLTAADLVPFHVLLICQTGLEPECIRGLRANCLVNPARGFVSIAYVKGRAHGQSHKTMRVCTR